MKQGPVSIQFFNLIDPVAKFSATWIDPVKTLFRAAFPVDQGDFKPSFAIFTFAGLGLDPKEQKIVNESLGREIIEGLAFEGFRRTIRVGEDRNIVASEEFWQSKELGLIGRRVGFGLGGTAKSQIRKLVRLEPDPVLFAMPQGYAIRDISQ